MKLRIAAVCLLSVAVLGAQSAPSQPVLGTVTGFQIPTLEIGVQPDHGAPVFLKFGPETQVLRVPPGDRTLDHAQPASLTDIAPGDRVLVSFVSGLDDARRIVVVSSTEIARRNQAVRQDWQAHGVSGLVASTGTGQITLDQPTPQGPHTITIAVTPKTLIRRYAPDSVNFADARPSSLSDIAVGDQLQARGVKNETGTSLAAAEIVFGTFLTKIGAITAIRRQAGEIEIQDLAAKQPVTIRLTADSRLKMLPDLHQAFRAMMSAPAHQPAADPRTEIARIIERLPPASLDDLKVGSTIIVTSTRGQTPGEITAITLLANADGLIQIATMHGGDAANPIEAISRMHGGVLNGPTGVTLPAIVP